MNKTALIIGILVLISACKYNNTLDPLKTGYGNLAIVCLEVEVPCLSEIIVEFPEDNVTFELEINWSELCYDFENDPLNSREEINIIFEMHPDNWSNYINWTPIEYDPVVSFRINKEIDEVGFIKIMNKTKTIEICN